MTDLSKNGTASLPENYKPISLQFSVCEMEQHYVTPSLKLRSQNEWVLFGDKHQYYPSLIKTYNEESKTHRAIINRKIDMICANGYVETGNESQEFKDFMDNGYKLGNDKTTKITKKVTTDFELTESFAVGIVWDSFGKRIAKKYHIPIQSIAFDKEYHSTPKDKPRYFWVCSDWSNTRDNLPIKVQEYSNIFKDEKNQIKYYQSTLPGNGWYTFPSYQGGLTDIRSEYQLSEFHYGEIMNGFSAGFLISFNSGVPTPEEMKKGTREIQQKFTGPKAQKVLVAWSNGEGQKPEITKIDLNDSDKRYNDLVGLLRQNIFIMHGVTNPMLYGVYVQQALGGRTELEEALEMYQAIYIQYRQKEVEEFFQELAEVNGVTEKLILKEYTIKSNKQETEGDLSLPTGGSGEVSTTNVAATALNGAQISSLNEIIANVTSNVYPPETGKAIIQASFPFLTDIQIAAMIDPLNQ